MGFFDCVKIKDIISNGLQIPGNNNLYNSEPWFLFSKNHILKLLKRMYGNRELFDEFILQDDGYVKSTADILDDVQEYIDDLFTVNTWKYAHLYDIYVAEYNPIWNVDGTEQETVSRTTKNTGTQENKGSGKDTLEKLGSEKHAKTGHDDLTKTGTEAMTRTGNETDEPTGSEKLQKSGSVTESNSGGVENSRTTFDSATFYGTDKSDDTLKHTTTYGKTGTGTSDPYEETTSFTTRKDTHTYNSVKDESSFVNRKDEQAYNSNDTLSFTGRKDETTYGKTDTRTDNLTENENISTMKVRQGNIGVTSTQKLMNEQINISVAFRFLEWICQDIAMSISYTV